MLAKALLPRPMSSRLLVSAAASSRERARLPTLCLGSCRCGRGWCGGRHVARFERGQASRKVGHACGIGIVS
jgi:hypothetical protein